MILSEEKRRWNEIQFYEFCKTIYEMRDNPIDVIKISEVICTIAGIEFNDMKSLILNIMNDPYYQTSNKEKFMIGIRNKCKTKDIARITGYTQQWINKLKRRDFETYQAVPKLDVQEDNLIARYLEIVYQFTRGIICN